MIQLRGNLGADSQQGCDDGQVWSDFYGSCVDSCPSGTSYNAQGICAAPDGSSTGSAITTASVGVIGILANLLGKQASTTPVVKAGIPAPVPATPWYMTWWGLGLLGTGSYFAYKSFVAPPTKAA